MQYPSFLPIINSRDPWLDCLFEWMFWAEIYPQLEGTNLTPNVYFYFDSAVQEYGCSLCFTPRTTLYSWLCLQNKILLFKVTYYTSKLFRGVSKGIFVPKLTFFLHFVSVPAPTRNSLDKSWDIPLLYFINNRLNTTFLPQRT